MAYYQINKNDIIKYEKLKKSDKQTNIDKYRVAAYKILQNIILEILRHKC